MPRFLLDGLELDPRCRHRRSAGSRRQLGLPGAVVDDAELPLGVVLGAYRVDRLAQVARGRSCRSASPARSAAATSSACDFLPRRFAPRLGRLRWSRRRRGRVRAAAAAGAISRRGRSRRFKDRCVSRRDRSSRRSFASARLDDRTGRVIRQLRRGLVGLGDLDHDFFFEFADAEGAAAELAVELLALGVSSARCLASTSSPLPRLAWRPTMRSSRPIVAHSRVAASHGAPEGTDPLGRGRAPACARSPTPRRSSWCRSPTSPCSSTGSRRWSTPA